MPEEPTASEGEGATFEAFKVAFDLDAKQDQRIIEMAQEHLDSGQTGLDRVILRWPIEAKIRPEAAPEAHDFSGTLSMPLRVTFFVGTEGLFYFLAGQPVAMEGDAQDEEFQRLRAAVQGRNARLNVVMPLSAATGSTPDVKEPDGPAPPALAATTYNFITSQEMDVLYRSACDGRTERHWRSEAQRGARVYEPAGASHRVELRLAEGENSSAMRSIEWLSRAQDADFDFAVLYVCRLLAPPAPLEPNQYAGGWIDLDDVAEKIGWYPAKFSLAEREALRARIWNYIVYGDRAVVLGDRTRTYHDRATGQVLDTSIQSSIWRIHGVEAPLQRALFGEVPRRVELVISKQWEPLLARADLVQYYPLAELLGSIPPNQVAGDWARCMGLALANLWRRKPREVLAGALRPTRFEILTRYTPKTRTPEEVLKSDKPRRAVEYWRDALDILVERGFLEAKGEPARSVQQMLAAHPSYKWAQPWLQETVDLRPGPAMQEAMRARAEALPHLERPKALPSPKKRGRPRKARPKAPEGAD